MSFSRAPRLLPGLALCLGLLTLIGCQKGPPQEDLKQHLQASLDAAFQPGVFEVSRFARNGSYEFTDPKTGEARLLVYTKARIRFLKAYSLSRWNQLNAGVLTNLLGATPDGIQGIQKGGNQAGDELVVFGTVLFRPQGDAWQIAKESAPRVSQAEANPRRDETPLDAKLKSLTKLARTVSNQNHTEVLKIIEAELESSRRRIDLALDRVEGRISFVSGRGVSEYAAIGKGLASASAEGGVEIRNYPSVGSVESCHLVGAKVADFAIVQNDVASQAQGGQGIFTGEAQPGLRAVCTLYPEAIQVVTRADAGIDALEDLAGKRVSLLAPASGSRWNALQVLEEAKVDPASFQALESWGFQESLQALEAGELDALFVTTAYPALPIENLATRVPLKMVPLSEDLVTRVAAKLPYFPRMVLAKGTYRFLEEDLRTLGVTAMVVTHESVEGSKVRRVLEALFDAGQGATKEASAFRRLLSNAGLSNPRTEAAKSVVESFITRDSARLGLSIPLHPAAQEFLSVP